MKTFPLLISCALVRIPSYKCVRALARACATFHSLTFLQESCPSGDLMHFVILFVTLTRFLSARFKRLLPLKSSFNQHFAASFRSNITSAAFCPSAHTHAHPRRSPSKLRRKRDREPGRRRLTGTRTGLLEVSHWNMS